MGSARLLGSIARPAARRELPAANQVRALREAQLLTKAELSRKAGISPLTLARIEGGQDCRVDTQRKILLALGLLPRDKDRVFGPPPRSRRAARRGR